MKKILVILFPVFLFGFAACKHRQKESKTSTKKVAHTKNQIKKQTEQNPPSATASLEQKLGISHKEVKGSKLYSFVEDWYGVPYKYGGCQKNGVDCSCFVSILCENVYNKKLPRTAVDMFKDCEKVGVEDAKPGDLFFFKINGNNISHVGVYLRKNYFVHSSTSKGVIVNSIDEAYYKKYFFCAGRINSL